MANHSSGAHSKECPCKRIPLVLSSFTAAEHGDLPSLLRKGTDGLMNRQDSGGNTPLHLAAQHGHVAATAALLAAGCNVNGEIRTKSSLSDDGCSISKPLPRATPLHRASYAGAVATMQLLLNHAGCDIMRQDSSFGDMRIALQKAVAGGRPLAVQLLLDSHQAQSNMRQALEYRDSEGQTALDIAKQQAREHEQASRSVARWDPVAGGPPDWQAVQSLLRIKAQMTATLTQLPMVCTTESPTPLHLTKFQICFSCDGKSGNCLTSTWEANFVRALSENTKKSICQIPPGRESSRTVEVEKRFEETGENAPSVEVPETVPAVESWGCDTPTNRPQSRPPTTVGSPCDACRKLSIALYTSRRDVKAKVCRSCRRNGK